MGTDYLHPLVSLCITCYNQERYVARAVKSALAQTYSPLEVVICDDCSTDGTQVIVEQLIRKYKNNGGKHDVVFHKNAINLGIAKNYEQCFKMGRGVLLVTGAGDDESMPNRVERIVKEWVKDGREATTIVHGALMMFNGGGQRVEYSGLPQRERPIGAMTAYVRDVFTQFDDIVYCDAFEDDVFTKRALLLGKSLEINEPLITYRYGTGESTRGGVSEIRLRVIPRCLYSAKQARLDIASCKVAIPKKTVQERLASIEAYEVLYNAEKDMISGKSVVLRLVALVRYSAKAWQTVGVKGFLARLIRFVFKLRNG